MQNKHKRYLRQKRYLARLQIRLMLYYDGKCRICGIESDLQFAHIKSTGLNGRGRGLSNKLLDINKHKDCYTLLCRSHHLLFDAGEISLIGVPF